MGLLSTIVGGAFSLFGANKAQKDEQAAINRQNAYNHPKAIRARAEEAGVHPSVFFGPGVGNQTAVGGTNYMGAAIADAGLMVADQLSKNSAAQKLERTERLNSKLQQQVTDLTIRPKVGGIYDQRVATPTVRQALGVEDGSDIPVLEPVRGSDLSGGGSSPAGLRPLPETDPFDPRRKVDHQPVKTHSGVLKIDSPLVGEWWVPTLDGDEPLQWYDLPTLGVVGGFTAGKRIIDAVPPAVAEFKANRAGLSEFDRKRSGSQTYVRPKKGDYYTHPETGFSAPVVPFGFGREWTPPKGYKGYTNPRYSSPSYYSDRIYNWVRERGH